MSDISLVKPSFIPTVINLTQITFITGKHGVGKTRLLEEVGQYCLVRNRTSRSICSRSPHVLHGRAISKIMDKHIGRGFVERMLNIVGHGIKTLDLYNELRDEVFILSSGAESVFRLAIAILESKRSVLLVDDILPYVRSESLYDVIEIALRECIDSNVQLVASTNSQELIWVVGEVLGEGEIDCEKVSMCRLQYPQWELNAPLTPIYFQGKDLILADRDRIENI